MDFLIFDEENIGYAFDVGYITKPYVNASVSDKVTNVYLMNLPNNVILISNLVDKTELDKRSKELNAMSTDELRNYTYKNIECGALSFSHVLNRTLSCNYKDVPSVRKIFAGIILVNTIFIDALDKILTNKNYDAINVNSGSGPFASIIPMGLKYNVTVNTNIDGGGGYMDKSYIWERNTNSFFGIMFDSKQDFDSYTITKKQKNLVETLFETRITGKHDKVKAINKDKSKKINFIKEALNLKDDDEVILFMGSAVWDWTQESSIFDGEYNCIVDTIKYISKHKNKKLIIREHPSSYTAKFAKTLESLEDYLRSYFISLPSNVFFIRGSDDVNSYSLLEIVDIGIVTRSSTAFEMIYFDIPVICTTLVDYSKYGFVFSPKTKEEYYNMLLNLKDLKVTEEIKYNAIKYYYRRFFERIIPYDVKIESLDDIVNNKSISLIADCILNEKPFEYIPG